MRHAARICPNSGEQGASPSLRTPSRRRCRGIRAPHAHRCPPSADRRAPTARKHPARHAVHGGDRQREGDVGRPGHASYDESYARLPHLGSDPAMPVHSALDGDREAPGRRHAGTQRASEGISSGGSDAARGDAGAADTADSDAARRVARRRPRAGALEGGDPGHGRRARHRRRHAFHARDAPVRRPDRPRLEARRQDLRHHPFEWTPAAAPDRPPRRSALRRLRPRRLSGRLPALLERSLGSAARGGQCGQRGRPRRGVHAHAGADRSGPAAPHPPRRRR